MMQVELACVRMKCRDHKAMLASLVDVTQRHLANRALLRENAELEQKPSSQAKTLKNAVRDVSAMTFALSHDLQVPQHAANGFASELDEKYGGLLGDEGHLYAGSACQPPRPRRHI